MGIFHFNKILFTAFSTQENSILAIMQNKYSSILIAMLFCVSSYAQIGGSSVYSFLKVPIAPRVAGVAGNVVANTDGDVNFGFWNPALINEKMNGAMSLSLTPMKGGVFLGEAAYSQTFKKAGSFLVGMKYVNYGEIQNTNSQAQVLGTFRASDYALQFGYGYRLDSNFQVGASLKVINSSYETYNSWGVAMDFSGVYQIPKSNFAMALIFRNLGLQLTTFDGTREKIPVQVDLGLSTKFKHVPLRLNVLFENLQQMDLTYNDPNAVSTDPVTGEVTVDSPSALNKMLRHVSFGAELAPSKKFNMQIGYSFRRSFEMAIPTRRSSAGLTFGLGIKVSKFRINYANTNMNVAGRMNHFGITTWLDEFGSKK